MKHLVLVMLLLPALATWGFLLIGPNAQASPATFTVNSTGDGGDSNAGDGICNDGSGNCTLRAAIQEANGNPGTDTIAFNIPGLSPHTIQPASALPEIADPVTIDGYTQPGATPNTNPPGSGSNAVLKIELDGTNAGVGVTGLRITAGSSTVKGLVINRFGGDGIELSGSGGNTIEGSYIGTDVNGMAALGNSNSGVVIYEASNTIGGPAPADRNVISGNKSVGGVALYGDGASGNTVKGNYIGPNAKGNAALPNERCGVWVASGAQDNTIGGSTDGERNLISGNAGDGVLMDGDGTSGNTVIGNYIGTNAAGAAALPNEGGVLVALGAQNNTIGGSGAGEGNVISGNTFLGIEIYREVAHGGVTSGNRVIGNYVGTDAAGAAALPNGGVAVLILAAQDNTIGGSSTGERNVIAYNASNGVFVEGATGTGNTISGNSIHSNSRKGIDLYDDGNAELAPPIIDGVGGSVSGHTNPKCYPCTVEVFSDDEDEGRIYHGSTTTNDDGTWTYPGPVTGPNITATATDANDNTSEFSAPVFWGHSDGDGFSDAIEVYLGTDPLDACPDGPSDDAWPLDMNMDTVVTVPGDVLAYRGNIGKCVEAYPEVRRLDLNADGCVTIPGDVLMYRGMIGETCP